MEDRLLDLLEYRDVIGALITSLDGLLVASVAVDTSDAELIAASTAGYSEDYQVAASEYGALHVARGADLRLIVLSEPGVDEERLRDLLPHHLAEIEDSIAV